jgi:Ion channel
MLLQLTLGSLLILATITVSGIGYMLMELSFQRMHPWLIREPHVPKQMLLLWFASLGVLAIVTASVWLWAVAFWALSAFPTLEQSLYFAIVGYTTLGLGDVVLPAEWRILSGMIATNGFINFGLSTAILIEAMRELRVRQSQTRAASDDLQGPADRN